MSTAAMLALPLGVLLTLFCTGAGLVSVLAPRLSREAQAAIAAPLGAAVFACASPLLHTGLPVEGLVAAVLVVFGCLTLAVAKRVLAMLRSAAVPLVIAAAALALTSAPALANGSWDAAAIDNTDPYVWVSEAKSMLDGPPAGPSSTFPDRVAYEWISDLRAAVAIPFGVASIAWVARDDPVEVYGAFAAVLTALLSLGIYFCARATLGWSKALASVAALAVVANAFVFYSTFNGWQAQIALALFGTLAIFSLRLALDEAATRSEQVLAAVLAGATVATYQAVAAPFAILLGVMLVGWGVRRRDADWRRSAGVVGGFCVALTVIALVPIVRSLLQLPRLADRPSPTAWAAYAHGLPGEALGLIPRVGTAARPGFAWSAIALTLTIAVVLFAVRGARRGSRGDVLLSTGAASLVAIGLLQLPGPSPYVSMKIVGYVAPILTLVALSGLVGRTRWPRTRVAVYTASAICFVFSTGIVAAVAMPHLVSASALAPIRPAVQRLPADAAIGIRIEDEWRQAWAVYYLRDRRLSVHDENVFVTGFGLKPKGFTQKPYAYLLEESAGGSNALWRAHGLALRRVSGSVGVARAGT